MLGFQQFQGTAIIVVLLIMAEMVDFWQFAIGISTIYHVYNETYFKKNSVI